MKIKIADLPASVNAVCVVDNSGQIFIYCNSKLPKADVVPVFDYLISSTAQVQNSNAKKKSGQKKDE